jgi:hypothetical protein
MYFIIGLQILALGFSVVAIASPVAPRIAPNIDLEVADPIVDIIQQRAAPDITFEVADPIVDIIQQ